MMEFSTRRTSKVLGLLAILVGPLVAVGGIPVPAAGATAALNFTWTPTGIPAMSDAVMAFDDATGSAVLFGGGEGGAILGDTWTWDGSAWTPRTPAHSPSTRTRAASAYDAATGTVVLFGGYGDACPIDAISGDPICGDTWTWNGTDWTHEHPDHSPPPSDFVAMAYDETTSTVVLLDQPSIASAISTWTWDGTDWHQENPANVPTFGNPVVAYDAATQTVVALGTAFIPPDCHLPTCI